MVHSDPQDPPAQVHVAGWTIVHVAAGLSADAVAGLIHQVEHELRVGANVALDLGGAPVDLLLGPDGITRLAAAASGRGGRLVTVEAQESGRDRLRAAGVLDVFESLDAALHDSMPVLRQAGAPAEPPPLTPASGDASLVATEDAIGGETAR